ncbi:hypothetical protein V6K52_08130 [Knoellia sp. S7-12]|uniref:hypothetical protein n=1 Tax=Knoellia sp. S7-12 TaxID=3126698 RepID=UPI003368C4B3
MKRISMILAALLLALVPATFGLWGNASFSQEVPVSVPKSGQVNRTLTVPAPRSTDDHGGATPRDLRTEPGDDRGTDRTPSSDPSGTPGPSSTMDDHGGNRPRDQRTEAGDDRDDPAHRSDNSGHGSDNSGHGSDDLRQDSRHGSDHGEDD